MKDQPLNHFDAEKLHFLNYKIIEENRIVPEVFDRGLIQEFETSDKIRIAGNLDKKLIRSQFDVTISTISENKEEAKTNLKFVFLFHCENFEELTVMEKDSLKISEQLGTAISAITYSTVRGILLVKLSDTVFSDFILPIVKPKLPDL